MRQGSPDPRGWFEGLHRARQRSRSSRISPPRAEIREGPTIELLHGRRRVDLPQKLVGLLLTVARAAAGGRDVAVMVAEAQDREELTSQQVADPLNVSRPYVVKLA